jgi:heme/copper-type cytochrome/quinol oxidase subunit 3
MSTVAQIPERGMVLSDLPIDQNRGRYAMWCLIATEFMLFVCMFGAYYYLGTNKDRWVHNLPPHLTYPLILLAVLLASSVVLGWGEIQVERKSFTAGRIALWITIGMGIAFLVLQYFEYADHWKQLTPYSDSYGSIFYAITTLHAAHVVAGLLFLTYVGIIPRYGDTRGSPHRAYQTVALYWHFVDLVWIFVVLLLYVIPSFQGSHYGH